MREGQIRMARFLRDPNNNAPPDGVEPRRLKIYQDLIYNTIEGFIVGGFPVLRSLYQDDHWHGLVRLFIEQHRCHSPYFLEISQEFIEFLTRGSQLRPGIDPPFIAELAHYEWVELALETSEEALPTSGPTEDILQSVVSLSPLAWSLVYEYPVHRIGSGFQPKEAEQAVYLVVYRNRADEVHFMELNALTSHLLAQLRDNTSYTAGELLIELADTVGMERARTLAFGRDQLMTLLDLDVLVAQKAR
ncbi:MAG: putative DNA-binding domain-containing protein [Halioglobus sp.]|nr:putative DNA-binding domain-containing protein [Halioglobus sp.]